MNDAIDIIHREHVNLDRVLGVLEDEVRRLITANGRSNGKPDLELLYSVVYYIRIFPDRVHHPKEEKFLFPALVERSPELKDVIDELERQHTEGERRIDDLEAALRRCDTCFPDGISELQKASDSYVDFQRRHMSLEERELMPQAREVLESGDWASINRAFAKDSDPLFGEIVETGFRVLLERITNQRR
jgi:branched-chain amino acid transport system ATP-binding protein